MHFAQTNIVDEEWFGPVFMMLAVFGAVAILAWRERGRKKIPWGFLAALAIAVPVVSAVYFFQPQLESEHPHLVILAASLGAVAIVGMTYELIRNWRNRR